MFFEIGADLWSAKAISFISQTGKFIGVELAAKFSFYYSVSNKTC